MTIDKYPPQEFLDINSIVKWELALIFISCYIIFLLYTALGLRLTNVKKSYPQKLLLLALIFIVTKIIIVATIMKWIDTEVFVTEYLIGRIFNLLWSPLMPIIVVWLYLAHAATSCISAVFSVPHRNIKTLPHPMNVFSFIMAGIVTTFLLFFSGLLCVQNATETINVLIVIAMLGSALELIHFKARDNAIRMSSPTWFWFCGTWLGAVILSLL